ncbi:helix-turn-helix domain-containing protein [Salmonella enterica subsp. diarizonae]|nr:helix-turn-helix domain-containing protein [Salmonella enterica subsp. diarizonae]EDY3377228.1 helix-turn-helix domain-containing protein [Salmonella enterica]HAD5968883.1 helix-turn-helix domain-containing protein [Salmonella enterica subsp. enterica serovar Typhimurium]EEM9509692.1 helix-turn-helix domain-containing protein [Salmonella enterica]ELF3919290.1 helix-turn-helix domain-containing protein [Salmonella enterica]
MEKNAEKLYRVKEVCNLLGMHRSTLYRKVANGAIEAPVKDGCRMSRFRESSIIKYQEAIKSRSQA